MATITEAEFQAFTKKFEEEEMKSKNDIIEVYNTFIGFILPVGISIPDLDVDYVKTNLIGKNFDEQPNVKCLVYKMAELLAQVTPANDSQTLSALNTYVETKLGAKENQSICGKEHKKFTGKAVASGSRANTSGAGKRYALRN
jgi:hypothetical protein